MILYFFDIDGQSTRQLLSVHKPSVGARLTTGNRTESVYFFLVKRLVS